MLTFLLFAAAFVCFGIETWRSHSLVAFGLALITLAFVIQQWPW